MADRPEQFLYKKFISMATSTLKPIIIGKQKKQIRFIRNLGYQMNIIIVEKDKDFNYFFFFFCL